MLSLPEVETAVRRLARAIAAPASALPTFGSSDHSGRPHVEVDDHYHYVVCERGQEFSRRSTRDEDRLLYWIFEDVTFSMAATYEVANRVPGRDFRRVLFRRQVELLGELHARWRVWGEARVGEILARHPYADRGGR
jgi:hypothetical protein